MEIYFKNRKLQKVCNLEKEAKRAYGQNLAKKLMQRMSELKAASCLAEMEMLPGARFHELKGNQKGIFSVDLEHPKRLLFIHASDSNDIYLDDGFDLNKITEIEIIGIKDTHDPKTQKRLKS